MADPNGNQTNSLDYPYLNPIPGAVASGSNAVGQVTEASHYDLNPAWEPSVDTQGVGAGLDALTPEQAAGVGPGDPDNPVAAMQARENEAAPTDASAQQPNPPIGVAAVAGGVAGHATVNWAAPVDADGYALTGYTVTGTSVTGGATTPVSVQVAGNVTTADVAGLTSTATYTFTVHATNVEGDSVESAASAGVVAP